MEGESEGSDAELETGQMHESPGARGASLDPEVMLRNYDKRSNKRRDQGFEARDFSEKDESWGWRGKAEDRRFGPPRRDNRGEWSGTEWRTKGSERRGTFRGLSMNRRGGSQCTRPWQRGRGGLVRGRGRNEVKYKGLVNTPLHTSQESALDTEELEKLSTKEPSEVAVSVSSHPALKALLGESTMRQDLLELLCLVLSKAFRSRADRGSLQHLAGLIKDSGFLRTVLPHYLAGIGLESDAARKEQCAQQLENILVILTQVLSIFPASAVEPVSLLLALLPPSICSLRTSGVNIPAQVEENMGHLQHLVRHLQTRSREGTLRSNKDNYALLSTDEELQNFRTIPIFPTPEELRHEGRPYLRPNLTSHRYPNTQVYLDTHFRLLREDFVRPLREGIQELIWTQKNTGQTDNAANQANAKQLDDIRVYHDTKIIAPKCNANGLAYVVQFNVEPLKFVHWENSKRLIFGSLVCLSCDNFESLLFATVADRDPEKLKDGKVQLIFTEESRNSLARHEENQVFLMVESTAFFEAYRYVLEGLQEQDENDLPFKKYFVDCSQDVSPPAYLHRDDTYDLSSVSLPAFKTEDKFHCLDTKAWPDQEVLGMDESQFRAFHMALTKELAIIQGPPGTGKTYVGLKIAQALLTNKHLWQKPDQGPILVVCYTNHALDQFLEGIYKFLRKGIVRVGGRSNSEILKRFNLKELTYSHNFKDRDLMNADSTIRSEVQNAEKELEAQSIQLECISKGVVHDSVLQRYISEQHWDSLHTNKVFAGKKISVIMEWLCLEGLLQTQTDTTSKKHGIRAEDAENLIHVAGQADLWGAERDVDDAIYSNEGSDNPRKASQAVSAMEKKVLAISLDEPEVTEETKGNTKENAELWEYQREQKKKLKNKIKHELKEISTMTEEEERVITDVWRLTLPDRWRLYRMWVARYRVYLRTKALGLEDEYQNAVARLADVRRQQHFCILKEALVIGMTTTGAAKNRHTLQRVRPSLVIVEEAAEVLEAHTITTLTSACQHLILIGDHQQLRPSATVYDLAKNFNLEMSMFERLVNMDLPFVRLDYQHRMRPDIARLLTPHIYSELENHPSVLEYDNIKGLNTNLFFVEHKHLEEEIRDGRSHQNKHEAQFVVALCRYLLQQEYKPEQITILTTYTGQLFCLRKLMPASVFSGVKVHVVDKYQGEENDIVLLSLVRSNLERRVGFLRIPNRVCVALSRAKKGLYCIGNSEMLGQVKLWSNIFQTLREKDQIGTGLTLCCQNHPSRQVTAATAADFEQAPEGGCTQPCEYRLDCGHVCAKVCHAYDSEHKQYQCMKNCQKILCDLGHCCPRLCCEPCNKCQVLLEKTIPKCQHKQMVPCHQNPDRFVCQEPCPKTLECGHPCVEVCGSPCKKCQVLLEKTIPQCQHKQMVPCHQNPDRFVCQEPCPKTLECGHPCVKVCGSPCTTSCKVKINYELKCGHNQTDFCFYKTQQKEPACTAPCKQQLKCGHVCRGKCNLCHSGRYHCDCAHKCERLLICSHKCQASCTTCPPCTRKCENRCVHSQCSRLCGQPCSPCMEPCAWQCPHQTCTKLCHEPCDRPPCDEPCDKVLNCGHPCIGLCGEKCPNKCRVCHRDEVTEIFFGFEDDPESRFIQLQDCGHVIERTALDRYMEMDERQQANEEVAIKLKECPKCRTPIRKNLRYGSHINRCLAEIELVKEKIAGKRQDILENVWAVQTQLEGSRHRTFFAELRYEYQEIESKLKNPHVSAFDLWIVENKIDFFSQVAKLMVVKREKMSSVEGAMFEEQIREFLCWLREKHQRFTEQQVYDLGREVRRLTLLAELNAQCNFTQLRGERLKIQMEETALRNVLEKSSQFTEDDEAGVKKVLEELKKKFPLTGLGISDEDRKMIVSAIQMPGHWFKCPNGHVYLITECGGAMERAKCPECKANIGGTNHSLASGNQLASEMDGVQAPAWPTALAPQLY